MTRKPPTFEQRYILAWICATPHEMISTLHVPPCVLPLYGEAPIGLDMHDLNALCRRGLVAKKDHGLYAVTPKGREEHLMPIPERSPADVAYRERQRVFAESER